MRSSSFMPASAFGRCELIFVTSFATAIPYYISHTARQRSSSCSQVFSRILNSFTRHSLSLDRWYREQPTCNFRCVGMRLPVTRQKVTTALITLMRHCKIRGGHWASRQAMPKPSRRAPCPIASQTIFLCRRLYIPFPPRQSFQHNR